jgi:hypothetical protein
MLGDERLQSGGHSSPSDQRQHYFRRVVGERPADTCSKAVRRGRAHHTRENIRKELPGNSVAVARATSKVPLAGFPPYVGPIDITWRNYPGLLQVCRRLMGTHSLKIHQGYQGQILPGVTVSASDRPNVVHRSKLRMLEFRC